MEYKLVVAQYGDELSEKVNLRLRQGWSLYGNPFSDEVHLYQGVTRTSDLPSLLPPFTTLPGQIGIGTLSSPMYSGDLQGNKP